MLRSLRPGPAAHTGARPAIDQLGAVINGIFALIVELERR